MENTLEYSVIGTVSVKMEDGSKKDLPIIDIKMMPDERWQELAIENAVHNYTREHGRAPESTEQALKWQRDFVNSLQAI